VVLSLGPVQLVALILALVLLPQPLVFLEGAARGVVAGTAYPAAPLFLGALAVATTLFAARRLAPGARGWALQLPVAPRAHRRAFVLGLLACEAVPAGIWLGLCAGGLGLGEAPRFPFPLAPLGVLPAAAYLAAPSSRGWTKAVALIALAAGSLGTWPGLLGAAACLVAVEAGSGALPLRDPRRRRLVFAEHPVLAHAGVAWAALGRSLASTGVQAAFPVAGAFLMAHNNTGLTAGETATIARAGCGLGAGLVVAGLAGALVSRRPPWAWSRSLPWSSRTRVALDAGFLALHALPAVAAAAVLSFRAAPAVAVLAGYLALRAAGAMRRSAASMTGLGWRMSAELTAAVIVLAWIPWSAWMFAAFAPLALLRAERRERALKVSLLRERHYLAAGDPSW